MAMAVQWQWLVKAVHWAWSNSLERMIYRLPTLFWDLRIDSTDYVFFSMFWQMMVFFWLIFIIFVQ